jgi:hypothetical protein
MGLRVEVTTADQGMSTPSQTAPPRNRPPTGYTAAGAIVAARRVARCEDTRANLPKARFRWKGHETPLRSPASLEFHSAESVT